MRRITNGWRVSPHADQRRIEMRLTTNELLAPLFSPIEEYPGSRDHPGGRLVRRGGNGVCVVVQPDDQVVLTVLWDGAAGRDDRGRPSGHRTCVARRRPVYAEPDPENTSNPKRQDLMRS